MASLALVTQDTTHAAATNTKAALETIGHTVTLVADSGITSHDFSGYDAILSCRVNNNDTIADKLRDLLDGGQPVILGYSLGLTAGTPGAAIPTRMHLTGNMSVGPSTDGITGCTVVDNTQYITSPFALGTLTTMSAGNFWQAVASGASYVGDVLCNGLAGSALADLPETLAIEAGTNDLQGAPVATGARCVVLGSLYGGQSAYTAAGRTLLERAINWTLSVVEAPTVFLRRATALSVRTSTYLVGGGRDAVQYRLRNAGGTLLATSAEITGVPEATFSGLTAATEYQVEVREKWDGVWTAYSIAVVTETAATGRAIRFTDFSEFADTAALAAEFIHEWATGGGHLYLSADRRLEMRGSGTGHSPGYRWSEVSSSGYFRIRALVTGNYTFVQGVGLIMRGAGGAALAFGTGYVAHQRPYTNKKNLFRINGTGTSLQELDFTGTHIWHECEADGTALRSRCWAPGAAVPAWDAAVTDANYTEGWAGVVHYHGSTAPIYVHSLEVEYEDVAVVTPDAPSLAATPAPAGFILQTSDFSPAIAVPDDEHLATRYELTSPADPTFSSPLFTYDYETPEAGLTFAIVSDQDPLTTYLIRVRHTGLVGGDSDWSETVEATTLDLENRPDTPSVTIVDVGVDEVSATTSAFSHPDGTTTAESFDPENPLPYLAGVHWQLRKGTTLVADTGIVLPITLPPTWYVPDLDAASNYSIRVLHWDGYYGVPSHWSAWQAFTTDAVPVDPPDVPTGGDVFLCDPNGTVTLHSNAFSSPDGGAVHAATQWLGVLNWTGTDLVGGGHFSRLSDPSSLLAITIEDIVPGEWTFFVRHGDDSGRWGDWFMVGECEVLEAPAAPIFDQLSGIIITADLTVTWTMPPEPVAAWLYDGEVSTDSGQTWTRVFTGRSVRNWLFGIAGRPDGLYYFRVRARYPSHDVIGEWGYLLIRIDRTGRIGVQYDFAEYEEFPETWEVLWQDDGENVGWQLSALYGGIVAGSTAHNAQRRSMLAFKELGEPTQFDAEILFGYVGDETDHPGWRWGHMNFVGAGLAHHARGFRRDSDNAGSYHVVRPGRPWGFPHFGAAGPCNLLLCPSPCRDECVCATGPQCYDSLLWTMSARRNTPGTLYEYGKGISPAALTAKMWLEGTNTHQKYSQDSLPYAGLKVRGLEMPTRTCSPCTVSVPLYTLRVRMRRTDTGGARLQTQLIGPGVDPSGGWQQVVNYTQQQVVQLDCGYIGLALDHFYSSYTNNIGAVFRSFTVSNVQYDLCEPPDEEIPFEPVPEPSRPCEVIVQVYHEDKTTLNWEIGDAPNHARPYLVELEHYGEQEIDIVNGAATIGQCAWLAIDKAQTVADQASGWLTERISRIHGLRNRILRYIDEVRGWVVIADGPASAPTLDESYAAYRATVRDTRDTERKVEVFVESSSWLLPMGVPDGWGHYVDADEVEQWLVPPATPLTGTYRIADITMPWGASDGVARGWVDLRAYWPGPVPPSGWVVGEEIRVLEEVEKRTRSAGQPLGSPYPVYYEWPDCEILWRLAGSGDSWTVVQPTDMMTSYTSDTWPARPLIVCWNAWYEDSEGDRHAIRAASDILLRGQFAEGDFPNDTDEIEVAVKYKGKPSTFAPLHLEGMTTGELLKDLYDGLYSRPDPLTGEVVPSGIRYNEADLLEMTDLVLMRITEPVDDLRAWTERYIYAPTGWVPALDNDGRISPRSQVPPLSWDGLLEVNNAITEPQPEWSAGERIVNILTLTYPRYYRVAVEDADAVDRLASREVSHEFRDESSIDRHDIQAVTYDAAAFAALGDEYAEPVLTVRDELGWAHADDRRTYILYRYSDGARSIEVPVMREECALLRAGDWVTLDLSWFPNTETGRRVLSGVGGQVLAIHDVDCAWRILWIEITSLLPEGS